MKTGTVHVYSPDNGLGVIKVSAKERYVFELKEWLSDTPPAVGLFVKFAPIGSMAKSIAVIRMSDELGNQP
jgi:hypothetical protein